MKKLFLLVAALLLFSLGNIRPALAEKICDNCPLTFAPVNIQLPTLAEMSHIFASMGLESNKIKSMQSTIIDMFLRMNPRTPNANGFIFFTALFRGLDHLKLQNINREQLLIIGNSFKNKLSEEQLNVLNSLYEQIDNIRFTRDLKNNLTVVLTTANRNAIVLRAGDIPTADQKSREMLEKYFDSITVLNGTTMTFKDYESKNQTIKIAKNYGLSTLAQETYTKSSHVKIKGISVIGSFPLIGNVDITPKRLNLDIDDEIPAQVEVGFKKGFFNMSYTFDLKN